MFAILGLRNLPFFGRRKFLLVPLPDMPKGKEKIPSDIIFLLYYLLFKGGIEGPKKSDSKKG